MNNLKQKLREYLEEQDLSWQILFGLCFLDYLGIVREKFEFDIKDAVKFCNDEQDYEAVYNIIEFLNFHEDEIVETLQELRFKPISWQYDFIDKISALSGFNITQTLDRDALTTAYGYALLIPEIDFEAVTRELDAKYVRLFQSAGAKMRKLKRNFVLALECMLWPENSAENLTFRELLALYVPRAGINEVIKVYKHALSPDVKLSSEEKECLAFAYYSPFFYDEVNISSGTMPEGSIFFCAETRMREDKEFYERNRKFFNDEEDEDYDDDEDEDGEYNEEDTEDDYEKGIQFEDSSPFDHLAVYIDPLQRCVIDTMLCDNSYANVYIEKLPLEKLNNTLPDFIRYHNDCLYTVEFVDNTKELDIAQKLNRNLAAYEEKIKQLSAELENSNLSLFERYQLEDKLNIVENQLGSCYFIC